MMHYSNCIELFPNVHDKDGGGGVELPVAEDSIHLLHCILAHCIKVHITLDCQTQVYFLVTKSLQWCDNSDLSSPCTWRGAWRPAPCCGGHREDMAWGRSSWRG